MKINKYILVLGLSVGMAWVWPACTMLEPAAPENNETLDGPIDGLNFAQSQRFLAGDEAFNGTIYNSSIGLGPYFVNTSCGSCHSGDGKGSPFSALTRFGQEDTNGNVFLDQGGPQLQNRALPGYSPEVIPHGATFAKLLPPAIAGLGFLELVSESDILAMADPNDEDGDGISGRAHFNKIPDYLIPNKGSTPRNNKYLCRFGKKASVYSLMQQTVNALNEDIGINSIYQSIDTYSGKEVDPEISTEAINNLSFYLSTLKAPTTRNSDDNEVKRGAEIFTSLGCASCHRTELKTGYSAIASLSNQTFSPYTDLLLHDMGPGLDDRYTEGTALSSEWRTPPLWGIGLAEESQGGKVYLLHDGRAHSIEQAIEMHGGEAQTVVSRYRNLENSDKFKLVKFLKSL